MQEIEKLRILQSQREAFRNRSKVVERERKTEEHTETVCPECKSRQLVHDYERAELVCQNCGLVIDDDFIDRGPEWRAFDHDQRMKRSRVGAPMTFTIHDKGLSTMIDWRNRDSYGRAISSKNRAQLYRLRKWQRRIRVSNATERNLAFALSELDRMASALGLPRNVRETAAVVYRDAEDVYLPRLKAAFERTGVSRPWLIYGANVYTPKRLLEEDPMNRTRHHRMVTVAIAALKRRE